MKTQMRGRAFWRWCATAGAEQVAARHIIDPFVMTASSEIEEGTAFRPAFGADGLIACVTMEARTRDVLMVAYMNEEALARTLKTGDAWYFSRSRASLWRKGESSGHTQRVVEIRVDCDQDCLLLLVEQTGPACHTARPSCFYRTLRRAEDGAVSLTFVESARSVAR